MCFGVCSVLDDFLMFCEWKEFFLRNALNPLVLHITALKIKEKLIDLFKEVSC